jgi:hypothetical protein
MIGREGVGAMAAEGVTVWRADARYRLGGWIVVGLLLLLSLLVLARYGWLAIIGVGLVLAACARTWWVLLRPTLTAGPDGVKIISGWAPVHLPWQEIRGCEPAAEGLKITYGKGRVVMARYPQQPPVRPGSAGRTEAEAAAAYLTERAAWARAPKGPMPTYTPPPAPPRGKK